jgi:serine/threonine protein kinase
MNRHFPVLECQGSFNTKSYATKPNDIWSLGIILINLIVGRNPWKQANVRDHTFVTFLKKPDFLKKVLPISDEVNDILLGIFKLDPSLRLNIHELRSKIVSCRQFKRPPDQHSKMSTSPRPSIATVANIDHSVSANRSSSNRSDDSWSSCYSDFTGEVDESISGLNATSKLMDTSTNGTDGFNSTEGSSLADASGPLSQNGCGQSLNTACSVASTASDGSDCYTPEAQLKNILWNHTTIQKYVDADSVPDDERLKDIYTDTSSAYCCPP